MKKKFKCALCYVEYLQGWSDEEAMEEAREYFPHANDLVKVCDDCYQKVRPDTHLEEYEKYLEGQ